MTCYLSRQKFVKTAAIIGIFLVGLGHAYAKDKPFPKAPDDKAQTMQACPEYGPGFFKAPGSDTCLQVGGRIRGETGIRSGSGKRSDAIDWRSEGSLSLDARDSSSEGRIMIRVKGVNTSR